MPIATLVKVVDGDTVDILTEGRTERVRLIGVDTPEVYSKTDCFGPEASAFTKSLLLPGAPVALEKDVSNRDRYERLLRYVYLSDGRMLNEVLVVEGYARVATVPPDVKYLGRFLSAQSLAKEAGKGLWSACTLGQTATPLPTSTAAPTQTPTQTPAQSSGCDPSYPTVCIPPPPPDLDCKDIPYRRFKVLPPDPHRFDGDKDGIGCES